MLDRYFYSVEQDEYGDKFFHLSGNIYFNDCGSSVSGKNYRCVEWTWLCLSLKQLEEMIQDDTFYEYIRERVAYIEDLDKEEAMIACERYFDGKPGTYYRIEDVNSSTPCGEYWCKQLTAKYEG